MTRGIDTSASSNNGKSLQELKGILYQLSEDKMKKSELPMIKRIVKR
jgi:hypothetical protein